MINFFIYPKLLSRINLQKMEIILKRTLGGVLDAYF